jgi:hypothetical protein
MKAADTVRPFAIKQKQQELSSVLKGALLIKNKYINFLFYVPILD